MFCSIICTDSLSPHSSASMVETEETPENTIQDSDDPEPADEGQSKWNTPLINCSVQV